ncbi:hypothetical protein [Sorangium sp. So ce590]|uniref:hypothetical protein n=1 Tax=unclassified Sorangium TaxID=2621164 RepID=UPI003F623533
MPASVHDPARAPSWSDGERPRRGAPPASAFTGPSSGAPARAIERGGVVLLAPEQRITTGCCQGSSASAGCLEMRRAAGRHGGC